MTGLPSDEFLTDYSSNLLQLSLPDNEQTWLHCIRESDPNSVVDLSYFLCWDCTSSYKSSFAPIGSDTLSSQKNTTTISLPKVHHTSERRAKSKHPNKKNVGSAEDSLSLKENSTLLNTLPIQSAQLNLNCNNEDFSRIELDDTNLVAQLTIDESSTINAKKSNNNIQDTTMKNNSNSWNISEHTLLAEISAPKGLMDSTVIYQTPSSDFSLFSKFSFNPNSVSTPTKKLACTNTDEISFTQDNLNEPLVNNNTLEDRANNTYSVSLHNEENNDRNENIDFNVTTTIPTSYTGMRKTADVEELEPKGALQNTYIFENSSDENSSANNIKTVTNSTDIVISTEDNINNKLDEPLNFPYNSEADFNSTITIKSKENDDSEEDSCYSSSSNIRSLGDVCDMSQLQPQKNNNVDCTLTKTRSEDSLCLPEHACSSRKPKKHYGSALSLETQNINQLAADRRLHKNPNYFLKKPGNQAVLPNESYTKHVSLEKTLIPTRLSKIPRLQSKIPKLISKK